MSQKAPKGAPSGITWKEIPQGGSNPSTPIRLANVMYIICIQSFVKRHLAQALTADFGQQSSQTKTPAVPYLGNSLHQPSLGPYKGNTISLSTTIQSLKVGYCVWNIIDIPGIF